MKDLSRKQQKELKKQAKYDEKMRKKKKRAKNREYAIVSYFFVFIFVAMIGYLVYYDAVKSEEFINSPYNTRQDTFADRVVRGTILSSDGEVLARTDVDGEGNETRVYPYSNIFAHAVGYADQGKSGLESEANFQLLSSHAFFLEQMKNQFQEQKNTGDTVVSTLDANLQVTAYNALGDRRGAVVVLQPSTGKILAMVSKPDFDPNTIGSDWEYLISDGSNSSLLNRATQGQYPPGSTFKIVTALDYYREHKTLEGFTYLCQGTITRQEHTIQCYGGAVHGQQDLYSSFANSCNCAFAQMGLDLGGSSLDDTADSLLFNQKLPLTMNYKRSSFSLNNSSGDPLIMQTSIGQGNTLVSPMHMALITSAIANNGVLMKPYMIDQVQNYQGESVSRTEPEVYRRLLSTQEANLLNKLMQQVVTSGTASSLNGRGYSVAGKTGSAEYTDTGESHSWFVGFSNTENPDLAVSIIVESGGTGSEAAVPIAGAIFDAYYYS